MQWTDEYSIGNPVLDEQHRRIALLISTLEQSVGTKRDRDRVHSDLVMLAKYNRAHFAAEENLMRTHAYPAAEEHLAEHRQFTSALADFERKSAIQEVGSELVALICGWEEQHVMVSDRHLSEHLGSSDVGDGAGSRPAQRLWADSEDADRE